MAIQSGTYVRPYEILSVVDAGGMGRVEPIPSSEEMIAAQRSVPK
jgi:hypothetical protein